MTSMMERDRGGSFTLGDTPGPIVEMVGCGEFLEMYKADATYRMRTPDGIDPARTNPAVPFSTQRVADVGSSNFVIARTLLQGHQIINAAMIGAEFQKTPVILRLHAIKEDLVICDAIAQEFQQLIQAKIDSLLAQGLFAEPRHVMLPQTERLVASVTTFLIHAKRALGGIGSLALDFYPAGKGGTNFRLIRNFFREELGEDSNLHKFLDSQEPFAKFLSDLRNGQEHPGQQVTKILDFSLGADLKLSPPQVTLGDGPSIIIHEQFGELVTILVNTTEEFLIHLVLSRVTSNIPYAIYDIPEADRRNDCPIRYRLTIDASKMNFPT